MSVLDDVQEAMRDVIDPCSVAAGNPMNIVDMGLVKQVAVHDGQLDILMRLTSPQCPMLQHFVEELKRVVEGVPEVQRVTVQGDSGMEWTPNHMSDLAKSNRKVHLLALVDRSAAST